MSLAIPRKSAPLRLAFIAPGNSIHTRRWLEYFAGRGHEVGLISYGRLAERIEGVRLLLELESFPRVDRRVTAYPRFVASIVQTRRALRAFEPDIVHAHFVTGPGWLGLLASPAPLVVSAWGSDVLVDTAKPYVRLLHRATLHRAACTMCDAEGVAERLLELGAPPVRIVRAMWGVDIDVFTPGPPVNRGEFDLPPDRLVVLSIRGLRDLQNPITVVRAFADVLKQRPSAFLALKLGPADDELAPEVGREIDTLGISAAVRVIARLPHERLGDLYRAADVCLSVPSSDGTSVALLEAMASGRPVVVSDIAANREWIRDGENGLVVPAADSRALSDALVRLVDDPELRAKLGDAARRDVVVRGNYLDQMRRAERIYRSVIWEAAPSS
jgi:glycosyltransferase involved in cell wall biosynthesis